MNNKISTIMLERIAHREDVVTELNDMMFELIDDNIISAFMELFQLPSENIEWVDVEAYTGDNLEGEIPDIKDVIIKVTFIISYYNHQPSQYVLDNFGVNPTDTEENVRIVTFGLPLVYCDKTKEEATRFILGRTSQIELIDSTVQPTNNTDISELSSAQQHEFNLLVHTHKGTIQ